MKVLSEIYQVFFPKPTMPAPVVSEVLGLSIVFPVYLKREDNYIMVVDRRRVQIVVYSAYDTVVKTTNSQGESNFFKMIMEGNYETSGFKKISCGEYKSIYTAATNDNNLTANQLQ